MEEYYDTLQFIRHLYVDRQYPLAFDNSDTSLSKVPVALSSEYISTHSNSYKAMNTNSILLPIPTRKYDTADALYINISASESFTPSDITIDISESEYGQPVTRTLTAEAGNNFNYDVIHKVKFPIKESDLTLDKKSTDLGNIGSIRINFKQTFEEVFISDLVFRTKVYNFTLEDLDYSIKSGEDHVKARLKMNKIPDELKFLIYKAGGAYAWLKWWQSENKVMDNGDENSKNYYNRLLEDVDYIIDSWIETNPEELTDKGVNTKLLGFSRLHNRPPKPPRGASRRWCR